MMNLTIDISADGTMQISTDWARPECPIWYRCDPQGIFDDDSEWHSSPYQRADVRSERDAMRKIREWLDESFVG